MAKLKIKTLAGLVLAAVMLSLTSVGQTKARRTMRTAKTHIATTPAASTRQDENKTPFVSKDGRFSVILPSGFPALKRTEKAVTTPYGDVIKLASYLSDFKTKTGTNHCVIVYTDYPDRIFDGATSTSLIELAQKGTLGGLPGYKILKDEVFFWSPDTGVRYSNGTADSSIFANDPRVSEVLGVPGRSTFVSIRDGLGVHYARFDLFLDKPRLYSILLAYDSKSAFDTQAIKNFFESFHRVSEEK